MKYFIASIFLVILTTVGFSGIFQNPIRFVLSPIQFGLNMSGNYLKDTVLFFTDLKSIHTKNRELLENIVSLESQVAELPRLREENNLLKNQLGMDNDFKEGLILTHVIGNPQDLTGATFIVNKGSSQGINKGDVVLKKNFLVGTITQVSLTTSVGKYITSPNSSIAVVDVSSPEKTQGVVEGQYGSSILMKRILPTEVVNVGDIITTSGKDGLYEPGFIIGKVKSVEEVPSEPLKSAYLETGLDLTTIDRAFIKKGISQ